MITKNIRTAVYYIHEYINVETASCFSTITDMYSDI